MAHVLHVNTPAPALPSGWTVPKASGSIQPTIKRRLLPAGAAYLEHVRLVTKNLSFEDHDAHLLAEEARLAAISGAAGAEEDDFGVGDEPESSELAKLDPKEWKKQDHYEVLGLSKFRYKATNDQIKVAHKKKVLKHHPDKKSSTSHGTSTNDDAFFKCIQKAMDVLTNPERRRQFDSVDPHYQELEEDAPTAKTFAGLKGAELERQFFRKFGPVFEREARFSTKQPVPLLGAPDAGKDEVNEFYNFWYNFDSWRSFEYLDKEVNEGSDSRDDKRYTEKKNKSERARRKKEDNARLRQLVDIAIGSDPRISRIKQEEKDARDAKKKAKSGTATPALSKEDQEAAKKKAEEDAKAKEEEGEVISPFQAQREAAKKAKKAEADARKKARRAERGDGDAA